MPKVGRLGASMLRGNANNFYIRDDADLEDQDVNTNRGGAEYPHIHVRTSGPTQWDDILYIGVTFGPGGGGNIDIFDNGAHTGSVAQTIATIQAHCPGISAARVPNLARYLHGLPFQVAHQ